MLDKLKKMFSTEVIQKTQEIPKQIGGNKSHGNNVKREWWDDDDVDQDDEFYQYAREFHNGDDEIKTRLLNQDNFSMMQ